MAANREYKDSVFTLLFGKPEALRELYGAVSGEAIPTDVPIVINTLKDVLYMKQLNDISFAIGNRLIVLIEHQSTINPNMPLRLHMYSGRIYEKLTDKDDLYTSTEIPIPRPEFIVLYNGLDPYPDEGIMRLSSLYRDKIADPALELTVKVYNINKGRNMAMLKKSEMLSGYAVFIDKAREFDAGGKAAYEKVKGAAIDALPKDEKKAVKDAILTEAIKKALDWCIDNGILPDFLKEHGSEVRNMLFTEWNDEDAHRVWLQDGMVLGEKKKEEEIARKAQIALSKGASPELVKQITGMDIQTIQQYSSQR